MTIRIIFLFIKNIIKKDNVNGNLYFINVFLMKKKFQASLFILLIFLFK